MSEKEMLEVYYRHYVDDCGDVIAKFMKPIDTLLEKVDNQELQIQIHEEIVNQFCIARDFFGVDGMKLANKIRD